MARIIGLALLSMIVFRNAMAQELKKPVYVRSRRPVPASPIVVPLDFTDLAWKPRPMRGVTVEMLETIKGDEDAGEAGDALDAPPPADVDISVNPKVPLRADQVAIKSRCLELWVYGESTAEDRDRWLRGSLNAKIELAREHGLSSAEEAKLRLAGMGDIKSFSERVEASRGEFESVRRTFNQGMAFLKRLAPLSDEFLHGPFDEGSLYAKVLRKIENDRKAASRQVAP